MQLFVYDLSGGMARAFSQMLLGRTVSSIIPEEVWGFCRQNSTL